LQSFGLGVCYKQLLAKSIGTKERQNVNWDGGWEKQVVEQLIKPAEKQQIMTHESKFTCVTSEKCGTRPRAWNDQGLVHSFCD
jgi:hypothetical protein